MRAGWLLVVSALAVACESAGERELKRCEALERSKDYTGAYAACMAATKVDDNGQYGMAARAKLEGIRQELGKSRSKAAQQQAVKYGQQYALASKLESTRRKLEKVEEQIAELKGQIKAANADAKPALETQLTELDKQHEELLRLEDSEAYEVKRSERKP
jgi:hypothetical protein